MNINSPSSSCLGLTSSVGFLGLEQSAVPLHSRFVSSQPDPKVFVQGKVSSPVFNGEQNAEYTQTSKTAMWNTISKK